MLRIYAAFVVLVCLFAQTAAAQDPRIDRTVILDINIIEITAARADEIETITKDRQRLNSLISEGKARQVASLQMRSRSNESANAQMGQRVPIQTATLPVINRARTDTQDPSAGAGIPQISYENIGLTVAATPRIVAGDQVEVRLKIEQSGIERSTGTLTPTFVHRNLNDSVRVRAGEVALLFGVVQNTAVWLGSPPASARTADPTSGSFAVLLTARIVD